MVQRIKEETARDTDSDAVKRAIVTATQFYGREPLWFTETETSLSISAGDNSTSFSLLYFTRFNSVALDLGDQRVPLRHISAPEFHAMYTDEAATGQPAFWSFFGEQLWVLPVPDATYTLRIHHNKIVGPLKYTWDGSAWAFYDNEPDVGDTLLTDAYTSDWFTKGEAMVRNRAKAILYADYLGNPSRAAECLALAEVEHGRHLAQADQLSMPSVTVSWGL